MRHLTIALLTFNDYNPKADIVEIIDDREVEGALKEALTGVYMDVDIANAKQDIEACPDIMEDAFDCIAWELEREAADQYR